MLGLVIDADGERGIANDGFEQLVESFGARHKLACGSLPMICDEVIADDQERVGGKIGNAGGRIPADGIGRLHLFRREGPRGWRWKSHCPGWKAKKEEEKLRPDAFILYRWPESFAAKPHTMSWGSRQTSPDAQVWEVSHVEVSSNIFFVFHDDIARLVINHTGVTVVTILHKLSALILFSTTLTNLRIRPRHEL